MADVNVQEGAIVAYEGRNWVIERITHESHGDYAHLRDSRDAANYVSLRLDEVQKLMDGAQR